ncbi:MAG: MFS transporter [Chloroflexota bacterium]
MALKMTKQETAGGVKSTALSLILLMGLVSAFGDIVYESARSVSGPYLSLLGASAVVVGSVSGLGEFLGYGLRLVSGYLADRTRAYWVATFIGYGMILCIPLLAFAGRWEVAAGLLILERIGKAVRSPARDTILSHAAHQTGRGWGFAIHEFLDQMGAIVGPLILSAAFVVNGNYRTGFNWLWLPAILVIAFLIFARWRVPQPEALESQPAVRSNAKQKAGFPVTFWSYAIFTFLSVAGFASFQLLSFHWLNQKLVSPGWIPVLYAGAMGVDALAALAVGKLYDRFGLTSLILVPFLTIWIPLVGFSRQIGWIVVSVILWGLVMAIHETTMRAAIADIAQIEKRGTGYGVFNTLYGGAWFVGGSLMGWMYQSAFWALPVLVVVMEALAVWVFIILRRQLRAEKNPRGEESAQDV